MTKWTPNVTSREDSLGSRLPDSYICTRLVSSFHFYYISVVISILFHDINTDIWFQIEIAQLSKVIAVGKNVLAFQEDCPRAKI